MSLVRSRTSLTRKTPLRRGSWYAIKGDPLRTLWSKIVRARDNHTCQRCGATQGQISAAHILGAGAHANLKYLPINGISLCDGPRGSDKCHPWLDSNRTKAHDGDGDKWVMGKIGADKYMRLLVLAKTYRRPDKATIKVQLKEEAKEFGVNA